MKNPLSSSVKLALAFLFFGVIWILGSDWLLYAVTRGDLELYSLLQNFKGILFVVLAALLIFFVSRRLNANLATAHHHRDEMLNRYNCLSMATNDAVWDYHLQTGESYTNKTLQEMFGYSPEELKDNHRWWRNNLHPDDKEKVIRQLDHLLKTGGTIWQDEYRFRCRNGEYKTVYDRGFILRDKKGTPYRLIGAMQDVTERKSLQRQLAEEQSRHKKEMAQGILQAEEAERKKLGEELHDNINQLLGVVKLYLQHAQVNPNMRQELLVKCSDYISETIEEIRNLSRSLLPPSLHEYGLLANLYQLIADIRQAKDIDIELMADLFEEERVPANLQLMLYRIIQEQLNNVLKHSGAGQVVINLRYQYELVQLEVSDNGAGFDAAKVKPGIGFNNIRNRLHLVNGKMQINTAPGKGCTLAISFVLPNTVPEPPVPFTAS